ncbi:MAG: TraB/GumN family protein [Deltaproteobacteria bacterium]|nr:TraB/GumN family protein [Deltaproteobacteria bacterium]MBW2296305.1 TraB/GumN family protein [Deltaproteobacteria bacterium]
MINNSDMIHRLEHGSKEILLIGTAHVSRESTELVRQTIQTEKPDTVCVELCESRFQSIRQKDKWRDMNIIKVIKEKKTFLLLSNLLLASFQKRIADKLDIKPGAEMIEAIESADSCGATIHLADRDIRVTLSRTWRVMGLWAKLKIVFQLALSLGNVDEITEEDVEKMKQEDMLQSLLSEVEKSLPVLRNILIDERDRYLAQKIKDAPGNRIVAVVGAGHVPGIKQYWEQETDIDALEIIPPKSKTAGLVKWLIPAAILVLLIFGFFYGGSKAGTDMLTWWVVANGAMAGIGAAAALGHPFTIVSSILAAPLTSLNPMIAAGWVSGLVEAFANKPKVKDLERLPEDILSIKGFWKNKVTRILLVVVFTNLGSTIGTVVAIPMMVKALQAG